MAGLRSIEQAIVRHREEFCMLDDKCRPEAGDLEQKINAFVCSLKEMIQNAPPEYHAEMAKAFEPYWDFGANVMSAVMNHRTSSPLEVVNQR